MHKLQLTATNKIYIILFFQNNEEIRVFLLYSFTINGKLRNYVQNSHNMYIIIYLVKKYFYFRYNVLL